MHGHWVGTSLPVIQPAYPNVTSHSQLRVTSHSHLTEASQSQLPAIAGCWQPGAPGWLLSLLGPSTWHLAVISRKELHQWSVNKAESEKLFLSFL